MSELKPKIIENGIEYLLVGDYYIPNLKLAEDDDRPIGRWGRMHRDYLKEYHAPFYNNLVLSCKLHSYLADLNEQAEDRLAVIIEQMKKAESVTEDLKRTRQLYWVQCMNSIRNRAEEIILHEMIYTMERS